jgi:hypothetical protein
VALGAGEHDSPLDRRDDQRRESLRRASEEATSSTAPASLEEEPCIPTAAPFHVVRRDTVNKIHENRRLSNRPKPAIPSGIR